MSNALSRLKWPLLVLLLCLPAAWPYLGGDLPRSNDSLTHLYRAVELDQLVRAGNLFPRWAPDFAHGYGYPVFNYFAYLSHYLIVLFHLIGFSFLGGLQAAYVFSALLGGLGTYLLSKTLAKSPLAGLVSAIAYVYSPYLLYTANVRGGLPENLALGFLPFALWAVYESLNRPDRSLRPVRSVPLAILAISGFIAAHVGMAIQYLPLIGVWGLYCVARAHVMQEGHWPQPRAWLKAWPGVVTLSVILALGLGLTAFLWLPSVVELPYVQFDSAFRQVGLVYTANFLHMTDLFAYPSLPIYSAILNPPVIRAIALPVVLVALSGLLLLKRLAPGPRADFLFWLAALIAVLFLSLDLSKPIWDLIPLLQRSTFPWRFLGPAALAAALMAGVAVQVWGAILAQHFPRLENYVATLAVVLVAIVAVPFINPPREPAPQNPTLADLARFEIPPLLVGTTTTGEYTPLTVKQFPDTHDMQSAIEAGQPLNRLDAPGLTVGDLIQNTPFGTIYDITASQPQTVIYRTFYFPGWQALLDGQPLALTPTDPNGLISFQVPAGHHQLELRFGSTPIRTFASWFSLICVLVVVGLFIVAKPSAVVTAPADSWNWVWAGVTVALAVGLVWILIGQWYQAGPPVTLHPLNLDYGGELTLLGYDQQPLANGNAEITLVWQAQHPLGVPYGFNVRLTDDRGLVYSDTNIDRPAAWRFYPGTDSWPTDQYILDSYILKPLPGTPPGTYHLSVIAYRADNLQALSDQAIADYTLTTPTNQPLAPALFSLDGLALTTFQADRPAAAPGDPYRLTLQWQANRNQPPDQSITLDLVDDSGKVAFTRTDPISPNYPPSKWKAGDMLKQDIFFRLPATLPGGSFHWRVGGSDLSALPTLTINEPKRIFVLPTVGHILVAPFGPLSLMGWDSSLSDKTLTVLLYWQANSDMTEAYRVFLHATNGQGDLVAQSDGEPVNWTRPTPGWLPGEVIFDSRTLSFSAAGTYSLEAGLVDEAGNRVGDAVPLGQVEVP